MNGRPPASTQASEPGLWRERAAPRRPSSTVFKVSDALSHIIGRHNLKLGGTGAAQVHNVRLHAGAGRAVYVFELRRFRCGQPRVARRRGGRRALSSSQSFTTTTIIDDSWRVRSNLTLYARAELRERRPAYQRSGGPHPRARIESGYGSVRCADAHRSADHSQG